ncbi:hypothetical protein CYMTET_37039 [Cymbomonas tetramitiformis]|uniref:Uncharacterized protein n=1 Tax=Cymbomonas tetramitiformis TaxID=36881 RepID=A0AAE0F6U8_9CHLO|nr:hypothetical protein CYMTET_37039 [Cymbomonas tetramitiformis]
MSFAVYESGNMYMGTKRKHGAALTIMGIADAGEECDDEFALLEIIAHAKAHPDNKYFLVLVGLTTIEKYKRMYGKNFVFPKNVEFLYFDDDSTLKLEGNRVAPVVERYANVKVLQIGPIVEKYNEDKRQITFKKRQLKAMLNNNDYTYYSLGDYGTTNVRKGTFEDLFVYADKRIVIDPARGMGAFKFSCSGITQRFKQTDFEDLFLGADSDAAKHRFTEHILTIGFRNLIGRAAEAGLHTAQLVEWRFGVKMGANVDTAFRLAKSFWRDEPDDISEKNMYDMVYARFENTVGDDDIEALDAVIDTYEKRLRTTGPEVVRLREHYDAEEMGFKRGYRFILMVCKLVLNLEPAFYVSGKAMNWVKAWTESIPTDTECDPETRSALLGIDDGSYDEESHGPLYQNLIPAYKLWVEQAKVVDVETSPAYDVVGWRCMIGHIEYNEEDILEYTTVLNKGEEVRVNNPLMDIYNDEHGTTHTAREVYTKWKATQLEKDVLGHPKLGTPDAKSTPPP